MPPVVCGAVCFRADGGAARAAAMPARRGSFGRRRACARELACPERPQAGEFNFAMSVVRERAHARSALEGCRARGRGGVGYQPVEFLPPVTLARKVSCPGEAPGVEALLPRPWAAPGGRVSLVRSQLTAAGARYNEVAGKNPPV